MPTTLKKILPIVLLALILRLAGIASRPIWYDEAFSILFAEKGPSAMLYGTLSQTGVGSADIHPLGYYTLLWGWINIFGKSIVAARILSIVISLASLVVIYQIARFLFNERTASIAAILFGILPFQIHFAQEIRMYGLLTLSLLLAVLSFLYGRGGNWKWWALFSLSSVLAQYTHNLAAFFLIPLALTPVFQKDWKTLRALIAAGLVSIIIYLPWGIHLPEQFSKVNAAYWVERPGFEKIFTLLLYYLPNLPLPENMLLPGLLFATLTIAMAAFQTTLTARTETLKASQGIWLAYLAFLPPLLLWLVSQYIPVYIERALLPSHAIFCIWLAWVFTHTKSPRPIQIMLILLIGASATIGFFQHNAYKAFPYGPFAEMNGDISSKLQSGDIIIHSSKLSYLPSLYYDSDLPQGYIIDPSGSNVDTLAPATREVLKLTEFDDIYSATENSTRIWFVIYQKSLDEYALAGNKTHPHLEYLNKNFILTSTKIYNDLRLYLFARK